ncbi:M20/M25/M40 family metallo-hydrolase [Arthrobacter crystallopoietes]|uniref:Aminopeptidase Y n=1 Tax=Crystallibacter crystallopoietes TaxID=37928 RepID=A0A1H0ZTA9_9MICC|nr:M20/M25/M40 family metallo-hydrolase [Arthrobacter crystallopoietes]SDQ30592.1 aminopeptidase Y [Arthrobacter crystallopoietes]
MRLARSVPQRFQNHPQHRTKLWTVALCAGLVGGVAACSDDPRPAVGLEAPPDPSIVREVVEPSGLRGHLEALQAAADANGGNRAAATGGYEASAAYVEEQLRAAGYEPRRQDFSYDGQDNPVDTFNILADTGSGSGSVLVLGAHLDSVQEGPGLNDNGSGVAAVLEVALRLAEEGAVPRERIRFAFWGGEEDGLYGSAYYVEELSRAESAAHVAYLNLDVVGSPNAAVFVYDGDGSDSEEAGPEGSGAVEQVFLDILRAEGVEAVPFGFIGDSDYDAFVQGGIPAGGLFTGDAGTKSEAEASTFGGQAGLQYDECFHLACDTIENVDMAMLEQMTETLMSATVSLGRIEGGLDKRPATGENAGATPSGPSS